jgi:hypothetical protein
MSLLIYVVIAVCCLMLFSGAAPLAIAILRRDGPLLEQLADRHMRVFEEGASAIFGVLRRLRIPRLQIPRRKDPPTFPRIPPGNTKQLPKP